MQRNDWRLRIKDMLDAVAEIQAFTSGMGLGGFQEDAKTLRAVEYDFVVLGEAARSIPQDVQARYPLLPWPRMIGLRNMVAHHYRRVDSTALWDTIQNDLPPLVNLLRDVLEHEP